VTAATPGQAPGPMKLYLAGPMRGFEDLNRAAFADAAGKLRADGCLVYNPAENDAGDLRANLAADMTWISLVADGVVLLPGWAGSRGATAENALRVALGVPGWELGSFPGNAVPGAVAAPEPQPAPELGAVTVNGELVPETSGNAVMVSPELGAAMAEARGLRELVGEVLAWLDNPALERPRPATLKAWRKRAGLPS
jgi:Domain of unknown function (DUF4406)